MGYRLLQVAALVAGLWGAGSVGAEMVTEPEQSLPLIQDVDVVVVGGTTGAVSAATSAARRGAKVYLVTGYPCLGEDIAGTLRVWATPTEVGSSDLMRTMFGKDRDADLAGADTLYTTPLRAKKALDQALLDAGVGFFTGCYATDVLTDEAGLVSGVVVVNRSGRQAIRAKVVVDATGRAALARAAGAKATPFPAGTYAVSRVVVTSDAPTDKALTVTQREWQADPDWMKLSSKSSLVPKLFECTMQVPFADGSMQSLLEAEQVVRDHMFTKSQMAGADRMFFVPPDHVQADLSVTDPAVAAAKLDPGAFRPKGVKHLYVLGAMADVPRPVAAKLLAPATAIEVGDRLGAVLATEAAQRPKVGDVRRRATGSGKPADLRDVPGMLTRPYDRASGTVVYEAGDLPVLAETDLLVVGGGTTGAPAAIGGVKNGLKTLVIEALDELGGVQTAGMITGYYYGFRRGFTKEIDDGVKATGWVRAQAKAEWYRKTIRQGGGQIWFGSMGVGAWLQGRKLQGVVVVLPDGRRGLVRAKAVIDTTGNADIAAAAGEPTEFYDSRELIGQGVGMAVIRLGEGGHNNDFSLVNDSDASDLAFFGLRTRLGTEGGWDVSQIVNSRERRRLVGVYQMTALDYLTGRTFPDTINQHRSRFDLHGQPIGDFFHTKNIRTTNHVTLDANAPYRALLPKTTDGLLVAALGMSATRDAMSILRMQPDLQNQGYAAAYAVYLALRHGCELRDIPVRELQKHLVEIGNIPESVLTEKDSYPISDTMLKLASHDVMFNYGNLQFLFAAPERAKVLLREKKRELSTHSSGVNEEVSLVYAHVLAMLGDPTGEDELIAWVKEHGWGDKWSPGRDAGMNRMCSYIIALGKIHSKKAIPVLIGKVQGYCGDRKKAPSTRVARAVSLAAQGIGDPALADLLAMMLDCPGVSGHAFAYSAKIPPVPGYSSTSTYSQKEKGDLVREVNLASALYRIGDKDGKGEAILKAYANDPRGFCADYARLVLAEKL
jgi:ribulose 1,5-bisphosphate synthetase/thiazole synthase